MRALSKLEVLSAALTVGSMAALAWLFRDRLDDPRYVFGVFASPILLNWIFSLVISRSIQAAPAELAHLEQPLSDQAGTRIYNFAMGILLFIQCLIVLLQLAVAIRNLALAFVEVAILAGGIAAAWYYRRKFKSPTIAPYAVSMMLTSLLMGLVMFGFDWEGMRR